MRRGGEPHLVVHHQMDGTADLEVGRVAQLQALLVHPLAGERGVAVNLSTFKIKTCTGAKPPPIERVAYTVGVRYINSIDVLNRRRTHSGDVAYTIGGIYRLDGAV